MEDSVIKKELAGPMGDHETVGTFFIGDLELALEAASVREVVPYPQSVTKIPLAPPTVPGMFSLRGEILPILDVGCVLEMESTLSQCDRRIAVVKTTSGYVGAVFDRTGEVLQIRPDDVYPMTFGTADKGRVIDGVIQIDGQERSIQRLSRRLLGDLDDVPFTDTSDADRGTGGVDTTVYEKAVIARVGDYEVAFEMEDLVEIQSALDVRPSPEYFEHCVGVVEVRGALHAVLDLRAALGLQRNDDPSRLIFVEGDGVTIALEVDALVETIEYAEGAPLTTPALPGSGLDTLCRALLILGGDRHVLFFDLAAMFDRYAIATGASALSIRADPRAGATAQLMEDDERSLLTFYVHSQFLSLDMANVVEVQSLPSDVVIARSTDDSLVGAMGLRGQVVPLIDLGVRLGVTEPAAGALDGETDGRADDTRVVVLVEVAGMTHGLIVDRVHSITRFQDSRSTSASDPLMAAGASSTLLGCIESALLIDGPGTDAGLHIVLDAERLVAPPGDD